MSQNGRLAQISMARMSEILDTALDRTGQLLVQRDDDRFSSIARWVGLGVLFFLGAAIWYYFLDGGSIPLEVHDWAEVTAHRYAFVGDAAAKGVLPLHMPGNWALRNVTDRFLSIPDTPFSPQFLLLAEMDVGDFVLLNTLLMYSIGFAGLVALQRELKLSLVASGILFGLLFFNGHIVAHMSVGHSNWAVYSVLPVFLYVLLRLEPIQGLHWGWMTATSGLLFFIFLQGAYHLFVLLCFFLGLLFLFSPPHRKILLTSVGLAFLLSSFRVLPPLLELGSLDTEFLSGFPTLSELAEGFVILKAPGYGNIFTSSPLTPLNWWEFDYYLGVLGFSFLLYFGLIKPLLDSETTPFLRKLWIASIAMLVFSVGEIFGLAHLLRLPLLSSQRVASRLAAVPVSVFGVLAVMAFQETASRKLRGLSGIVVAAGFLVFANDLWQHLKLWRVSRLGAVFPEKEVNLALDTVANHPDPEYFTALAIGAFVSLGTAAFLLYMFFTRKYRSQE